MMPFYNVSRLEAVTLGSRMTRNENGTPARVIGLRATGAACCAQHHAAVARGQPQVAALDSPMMRQLQSCPVSVNTNRVTDQTTWAQDHWPGGFYTEVRAHF